MKLLSLMLITVLSLTTLAVFAQPGQSSGTISFQGQIVDVPAGQSLTKVTPSTMDNQTVYVVSSAVTNRTLATFSTAAAANTFASQVTPATAVSQ